MARLSFFAALERLIERPSPTAVVALFVLPFIPIIPLLKLAELWLASATTISVWAAIVIVAAKVAGAAFSTRIFAIARPKLLQVLWFARAYGGAIALACPSGMRPSNACLGGRRRSGLRIASMLQHAMLSLLRAGSARSTSGFARSQGRMGRRLAAAVRCARG